MCHVFASLDSNLNLIRPKDFLEKIFLEKLDSNRKQTLLQRTTD
jgi:hypothetical protein